MFKIGCPLFADHMVVQRNKPLRIWGTCRPHSPITITLGTRVLITEAGETGDFDASIPPQDAGGPYVMVATDGETSIHFVDVMVGEVVGFFGQSNAGKPRVFPTQWRTTPAIRTYRGGWLANPGAHPYAAAKCLAEQTGVTVGLVNESAGGSRIIKWRPGDEDGDEGGLLFRRLIDPIIGYQMGGIIWWQGEADTSKPEGYGEKLIDLITGWRSAWDSKSPVPFTIVTIPTGSGFMEKVRPEFDVEYAKVVNALEKVALVDTQGLEGALHPSDHDAYGARIATVYAQLVGI